MKTLINKISLILLMTTIAAGCGGGDSAPSTDPNTVFPLFPAGKFVAGYTENVNLTGTDTAGSAYTVVYSSNTQSESTFIGDPAIPILLQIQMTNTTTGAFVSAVGTDYYTPSATDRRYLGYSGDTTTVSAITQTIPQSAKINDFGFIGTYTDNVGDVEDISWRLDDAGGGNANIVQLLSSKDQFGTLDFSSIITTTIDVNGKILHRNFVLFYPDVNVTVTLNGS